MGVTSIWQAGNRKAVTVEETNLGNRNKNKFYNSPNNTSRNDFWREKLHFCLNSTIQWKEILKLWFNILEITLRDSSFL